MNITKSNFNYVKFYNCIITNSDFFSTLIIDCEFVNCDIPECNFKNSFIYNTKFFDCNLIRSDFSGVQFDNVEFNNCNLSSVVMRNIYEDDKLIQMKLQDVDIFNCQINGLIDSDTKQVIESGIIFNGISLQTINFHQTDLSEVIFNDVKTGLIKNKGTFLPPNYEYQKNVYGYFITGPGVDLNPFNLSGLDLRNVELRKMDLSNRDLSSTILDDKDLSGMNLQNTNFNNASLRFCKLFNCNLTNVNFTNTDIYNALFFNINTQIDWNNTINYDYAILYE